AGYERPIQVVPTVASGFHPHGRLPDASDEALNHVAVFQSYVEKVESAQELIEQSSMTLHFIHAHAIELEGSVSSKRPHLRGDKPGITEKRVSLLRDGIDPR